MPQMHLYANPKGLRRKPGSGGRGMGMGARRLLRKPIAGLPTESPRGWDEKV